MVHGFMHDYPMHDISNHKLLSTVKKSTFLRMPHLPGTLEERKLNRGVTEPVLSLQQNPRGLEGPSRIPFLNFTAAVSPDRIKLPAWIIPIGRAIL